MTGDHGFQDVRQWVQVNEILARAGLGGCPWSAPDWRATAHVAGGSATVFVSASAAADTAARAEEALRREARDRYTIVTRRELLAAVAAPARSW